MYITDFINTKYPFKYLSNNFKYLSNKNKSFRNLIKSEIDILILFVFFFVNF